jgi:formate C-acetyltransferase
MKPGSFDGRTRVAELRERIIAAPQEVCIERARYLTQAMAANWGQHPLTRMSLALEHILANQTVTIRDGELIVGCRTSKLKGAPLFPENKWRWIEGDLDGFAERVYQPALITEAEKRELREDILPFWEGRSVEDRFLRMLPADVEEDLDKYVVAIFMQITNGIGHFTLDLARVLRDGLAGIAAEAAERMRALTGAEKEGEA